jgi:hypothetical protein
VFGLSDREFDGEKAQDDSDSRLQTGTGDVSPGESVQRSAAAKQLAGRLCCLVGLLLAIGGVIGALVTGSSNISAGAVGAALGILGYFLGSNRLGTVTVVVSIAALFFGLAASQGYIPFVDASDRTLPDVEPRAD